MKTEYKIIKMMRSLLWTKKVFQHLNSMYSKPGRVRTSVRGHGSVAEEIVMSIRYSWPQEPGGYDRTAQVYIPHSQPGEKVPVVFTLHGNNSHIITPANVMFQCCLDNNTRSWRPRQHPWVLPLPPRVHHRCSGWL